MRENHISSRKKSHKEGLCFCAFEELIHEVLMYNWIDNATNIFPPKREDEDGIS